MPAGKVIVDALDDIICHQGTEEPHRLCLETVLNGLVEEISAAAGEQLRDWLLGLVGSPEHRLVVRRPWPT